MSSFPLEGLKVIELGGRGPGPFAGMVLADYGADVIVVERPQQHMPRLSYHRGKRSIDLNVKADSDKALLRQLLDAADVCIEGFRPGVVERWGLGPDQLHRTNPRLVFARVTGWGQTGPLAQVAGHDINYVALSGVLNAIGPHDGPPSVPLNLLGDFAGGGMVLVAGILAALYSRSTTGRGDVIDAAMLDGVLLLAAPLLRAWAAGDWILERERNRLDGGSPHYGIYRTADNRYLAVSANEPERWTALVKALDLPDLVPRKDDRTTWPDSRERIQAIFATRKAQQWLHDLQPLDACVSEVLDFAEMAQHPHVVERGLLAHTSHGLQARPAPRFLQLSTRSPAEPPEQGADTAEILRDWLRLDGDSTA